MKVAPSAAVLALSLLAFGCKPQEAAPSDAPPAVKGLAAAGNDAAIVALAKKTLACPWKADSLSFDTNCADWKAWNNTNDAFTTATSDATFVNMIEDVDVKVRLLASAHLGYDSERKWVSDPALAKRVIAAAAAETQSHYDIDATGKALARIQYAKTGLWPQAKAAVEGTALKSLARNVLEDVLDFNETFPDAWNWVKAKTKDADKSIASAAVVGFTGLVTRKQEACAIFAGLLGDERVGADAAQDICYHGNECTGQLDAALNAAEARAKAGTVNDSSWPLAAERATQNIKASDAQKKRAFAILTEIAANPHIEGWSRASALRDMASADKVQGKALAARYLKDKDSSVASAAKDVLAAK